MNMKYLIMGILLCSPLGVMANNQAENNHGQEIRTQKQTEAQALAAEKKARADEARVRHQARIEEERTSGKPTEPLKRRYSIK